MEWSEEIIEEAVLYWEDNGGINAVVAIFGGLQEGVELGVIATSLGFEGATAAFQPQLTYQDRLQYFALILRRLRGKHNPREAYVRYHRIATT